MKMENHSGEVRKPFLLSAEQLAAQLQVSLSKAYTIMRQGEIPVVKMGRSVRVRQQDVDRYILRNTLNAFDLEE